MQSDPQDEQSKLPASRDGEPQEPVGDDASAPPVEPADAPPPTVAPRSAAPPRMPAPPLMPSGGPPPSAWGSTPPPPGMPQPDVSDDAVRPRPDEPVAEVAAPGGAQASEPGVEGVAVDAAPGAAGASASTDPAPARGVVHPTSKAGVAPVVQGDWLASVCPYLTSADGTYRSAAPDEGHRCTAQDPATTLPLAFQERFCLTDRHPRCEMYKFAQETNANGAIPAASVPPTDPPTPRTRLAGGGGPSRPLLATLAGIGGLIVVVLLVTLFMGSCSGDGDGTDPGLVPDEQATEAPARTPAPTPAPTPESEVADTPAPDGSASETVRILYEIQPDEALLKISETFGITRNRIRRENPELDEVTNAEMSGMIIELPIVGDMTLADAEALPGYVGLVSELEADAEAQAGS